MHERARAREAMSPLRCIRGPARIGSFANHNLVCVIGAADVASSSMDDNLAGENVSAYRHARRHAKPSEVSIIRKRNVCSRDASGRRTDLPARARGCGH